MKAVMVMYDSLNRHMLPNYGCDWTLAPNFIRLGERAVTFDNHYVGSMPCIPARRELHTGRHNFLHRRCKRRILVPVASVRSRCPRHNGRVVVLAR